MASLPNDVLEQAKTNFLTSLSAQDRSLVASTVSPEDLIADIQTLDLQHAENSRTRKCAAMLTPVIYGLEQYGKALDVISNVKPDVLCLLWGAIRILIRAVTSYVEYYEKLLTMLQQLGDNLARFKLYAKLYPERDSLKSSLLVMYEQVLGFCLKVKKVFVDTRPESVTHKVFSAGTRSGLKAMWKPFKIEFGDLLELIRYRFDLIEKEANAAEKEESSQFRDKGRVEIAAAEEERQKQAKRWDSVERHQRKVDDALNDEQRRATLQWLPGQHIDPNTEHVAARKLHHPHSGEWFLNSDEYREWRNTPNSSLWVHAIPGAGKTILVSTIIEELKARTIRDDITLIFFYCRYDNDEKRSWANFVASAVRQLSSAFTAESQDFLKYVNSVRKNSPGSPDISKLLALLIASSRYFKQLVVVVDALDECEDRVEFIQGLDHLKHATTAPLRFLVSSRRELDITQELSPVVNWEVAITKDNLTDDVRSFVAANISSRLKTKKLKLRDPTLENHIVDRLVEGSDGMFQWVKCQLDQLRTLKSDKAIKHALATLPKGLDDTYNRILGRIRRDSNENLEEVIRLLRWIAISITPLTVNELAQAIAIKIGDRRLDFSAIVTDPMDILDYCGAFVVETQIGRHSYVNLAHFSIKEYFMSERILDSPIPQLHLNHDAIQTWAASTCLKFLCLEDFACGADYEVDALLRRHEQYPFLFYAAHNWKSHFNHLGHTTESADLLMQTIFKSENEESLSVWQQVEQNHYGRHGGADLKRLRERENARKMDHEHEDEAVHRQMHYTDYSPLHIAAHLGHIPALKRLLDDGRDVNLRFDRHSHNTPLWAAVKANKLLAVRYLLERGGNPDLCSEGAYNLTPGPLQTAAKNHSLEVVRALLEHGCDVNIHGENRGTPLLFACHTLDGKGSSSRLDIAHLLLDFGADVELLSSKPGDAYGSGTENEYTPLHLASELGDLEMVRLLLSRDADIEAVGGKYGTSLQAAAAKGHTDIVTHLLNSGADINGIWGDYNGPIHAACKAKEDPFKMVGMLLDRGAEIYLARDSYRNALRSAALQGYTKTLRLLLDRGPSPSEKFPGETLASSVLAFVLPNLSWPECHKILGSVARLGSGSTGGFSEDAVEIAATAAASNTHLDAVTMLLDTESGKHLSPQALGRVLFSASGKTDASELVSMLLSRGAVVDTQEGDRGTALVNAVEYNQIETVKILLAKGADVNAQSPTGKTAILAAASNGYIELLQLLIHEGANVEGSGALNISTPLVVAVERGRFEAVKILLSARANIDVRAQDGTALIHAAAGRQEQDDVMLRLLIESGATVDTQDMEGNTALHAATRIGRLLVVKLLLESGALINIVNRKSESPLHIALSWTARAIDPKSKKLLGNTPPETWSQITSLFFQYGTSFESPEVCEPPILHLSVMSCEMSILEIALKQIRTPRLRDKDGKTPLHLAAETGQLDMIRLLITHGFGWRDLDNSGCNILLAAIRHRQPEVVTFLSDSSICNIFEALVTEPDADGRTALQYAILAGFEEDIVDELLKSGADPRVTDMSGRNALHYVLMSDTGKRYVMDKARFPFRTVYRPYDQEEENRMFFTKLFMQKGVEPNGQDEAGETALLQATREFFVPIITYLLDHGADPKISNRQGISVLHCISMSQANSSNVVDMLLSRGADINARDNSGCTVLHCQMNTRGSLECAKFLVSRGARANILDKNGQGEIHHLILGKNSGTETMGFLRDRGVYIDIKDEEGATLLHHAVCNQGEKSVLEFLLRCGIDINATDKTGSTALHYAVERYEGWNSPRWDFRRHRYQRRSVEFKCRGIEEVQFLLENGADTSARDERLRTPLHRILQRNDGSSERLPQIVEILLKHKADPLATDVLGRNAIDVCLDCPEVPTGAALRGGIDRHRALHTLIKSCGGLLSLEDGLRERVASFQGFSESSKRMM